ncbi:MAG: aldehyde ferredoxin oxidoreductase family protein [Thermoplasmata archaeon]
MSGYWNKILVIDLSSSETWTDSLNTEIWAKYIGGVGIGSYLFDRYGGNHDAFSPSNPIIITTGPLVGTAFPNTGRHEIVSRSPQTSLLGESNSGGHFGYMLKRAGYDGIIIKGAASDPISIFITPEKVWIENARALWGLDIYRVQEKIKQSGSYSIMAIGPAGENKVLFSAVMNDEGRAAGRTGMGAVFGAKKLKAIAVKGNLIPQVANKIEFNKLSSRLAKEIFETPISSGFRSYGSMIWIDGGQGFGDVPANYFKDHAFTYDTLSAMAFHESFKVSSYHCSSCVIGCGRTITTENGTIDGPEYETVAAFGSLLGNTDLGKIVEWNHAVNSLGLDSISTGVFLAALRSYLKNGILKDSKISEYFDESLNNIGKLIEDIAYARGAGKELAVGLEKFARAKGIDRDQIATVKGLEIPMHDPRAFKLQGLGYATSSRGADHMQADMYQVDIGGAHEEIGITMGDRWNVDSDDRVMSLIKTQDYRQVYNSAILCYYAQPSPADLLKGLNLATGFELTLEELMQAGSNIVTLKRKINESLGLKSEDDWLPALARKSIENEPEESGTGNEELESLLKRYYRLRNWNR